MSIGYIDTSAVIAIGLEEKGAQEVSRKIKNLSHLVSSNLLEAELRSVFWREKHPLENELVANIEWVFPTRSLNPEFSTVLNFGYLRGADLLHVSTALYVSSNISEMSFITLDRAQREVAAKVGFQT